MPTFPTDRRRLLGTAVAALTTAGLGRGRGAQAQTKTAPFPPLRQVDAGLLNVAYVEMGPVNAPAVVLLHGGPDDIHS
jgi:hypothetical protein